MPDFVYQEPQEFMILPPGDYVCEVRRADEAISKGSKTQGADTLELMLLAEGPQGAKANVFETLIFHPSCAWKVSAFAKAFGVLIDGRAPAPGDRIRLASEDVVRLRGWVTLGIEEYNGQRRNRVRAFLINKPRLARSPAPPPDLPDFDNFPPADDDVPF